MVYAAGEAISMTTGVASKEACAQLCKEEPECVVWNYDPEWTECKLKKSYLRKKSHNSRSAGQPLC